MGAGKGKTRRRKKQLDAIEQYKLRRDVFEVDLSDLKQKCFAALAPGKPFQQDHLNEVWEEFEKRVRPGMIIVSRSQAVNLIGGVGAPGVIYFGDGNEIEEISLLEDDFAVFTHDPQPIDVEVDTEDLLF